MDALAICSRRISMVIALSFFACTGCTNPSSRDLSLLRGNEKDTPVSEGIETSQVNLTIWHDSLETAQRQSEETGKPILADFTGSDWCGWCTKLKKDVFETSEFKAWAHENVVLLELDYPKYASQPDAIKQQNKLLREKYNVQGYPTVLLLSPEGDVLGKMGYKKDPDQWIESAKVHLAGQQVNHQFR